MHTLFPREARTAGDGAFSFTFTHDHHLYLLSTFNSQKSPPPLPLLLRALFHALLALYR